MPNVNEINIKIDKAIITSVTFKLNTDNAEEPLAVQVYGELLTDKNKKVTSFSYDSDGWSEDQKFEVPVTFHAIAKEVFQQLTPIIYEKINGTFKALPGKKEDLPF